MIFPAPKKNVKPLPKKLESDQKEQDITTAYFNLEHEIGKIKILVPLIELAMNSSIRNKLTNRLVELQHSINKIPSQPF